MIIEKRVKFKVNVKEELSKLQEEINDCKFPMERASLLLKKIRLLRLQELKELAKGINYKKIVEDLNNYMRGKEKNGKNQS